MSQDLNGTVTYIVNSRRIKQESSCTNPSGVRSQVLRDLVTEESRGRVSKYTRPSVNKITGGKG